MIEQAASANVDAALYQAPKFKPLQEAQLTWVRDEDDNNWVVRDNDGKELFQMPGKLTDKEAMAILRAFRPFEFQAFEDGKQTGMEATKAVLKNQIVERDFKITMLERQNQELAEHLDRLIGGE